MSSVASSSRESSPSSTVAEPDAKPAMAKSLIRCSRCQHIVSKKCYKQHRKTHDTRKPCRSRRLDKLVRCARCLHLFAPEVIEDHRKTHRIARGMPLSERLPPGNACTYCRDHGCECIVASQPNHTSMQTLRCLECLSRYQLCSFERDYRSYRMQDLTEHPAVTNGLLTPSPSETESESPDTALSSIFSSPLSSTLSPIRTPSPSETESETASESSNTALSSIFSSPLSSTLSPIRTPSPPPSPPQD
ncbi:hypothetical protein E4U53_005943 [Claviceps sorghi]|nr:hypothetical protein E4U53_005943 [Claviceps sorghi]